ncbi:hypothetical protein B0H16DRAFT_1314918, partial [Mycena metata]
AHAYLTTKPWGEFWTALLAALVKFEWSHFHVEERGRLVVGKSRPDEFHQWIKEHRVYDDYKLNQGFGERLLAWWKELGPKNQWAGVEAGADLPADFRNCSAWATWGRVNVPGRNGLLLIVLGLAWWGQAVWNEGAAAGLGGGEKALASAADWKTLAEDVKWVMEEVVLRDRLGDEAFVEERDAAAAVPVKAGGKKPGKGKR